MMLTLHRKRDPSAKGGAFVAFALGLGALRLGDTMQVRQGLASVEELGTSVLARY